MISDRGLARVHHRGDKHLVLDEVYELESCDLLLEFYKPLCDGFDPRIPAPCERWRENQREHLGCHTAGIEIGSDKIAPVTMA